MEMEESEGDIWTVFVAAYYRVLFSHPEDIIKFYDPRASVSRNSEDNKSPAFSPESAEGRDLLPFDPSVSSAKIFDAYHVRLKDGFSISVFGSVIKSEESFFSQNFFLSQRNSRWFIISDHLFIFEGLHQDLIGAENQARAPVTLSPQVQSFTRPINPFQSSAISAFQYQRRPKLEQFDPNRSITVSNLANSYTGDDVARLFSKFGDISSKWYT
jgi:hypothetical protein